MGSGSRDEIEGRTCSLGIAGLGFGDIGFKRRAGRGGTAGNGDSTRRARLRRGRQ